MCGLAGAIGLPPDDAVAAVQAMCDYMRARGPDDEGVELVGGETPTGAIGSRRLAIIDPSSGGHQPMLDEERGNVLAFNGMIYNFRELRAELAAAGERFRSDSDTEVILRAYGRYGWDCVRRLRGMFALAVWDSRDRTLFLARDRLGIKPLYYSSGAGRVIFASQVKALVASGLVEPRLSVTGIQTYLSYGAVSDPLTAVAGVRALPAGHSAVVRDGAVTVTPFWRPPTTPDAVLSRGDAVHELRRLLEDVVGRHLLSDAPLGVFLSGGVDSSVVAALAAAETPHVRTVSVVFDDPRLSEAEYIDLVADHLQTDHVRVPLTPDDLLGALSGAFEAMDQPTFDGINTYVVSQAAAGADLKVALSGLGGDELFDGYGHVSRVRALERVARLPRPVAKVAAQAVAATVKGSQGAKASEWLRTSVPGASYDLLRRLFFPSELSVLGVAGSGNGSAPSPRHVDLRRDVYSQVSVLDLTNYTKNVLLRDTDAMSMAHSLEVRVPLLDDALVDWVLRLPETIKAGRAKALLVDAVRDLLPPETLARRKQGFVLPFARWLRGELHRDVDERLRVVPTLLEGIIDPAAVGRVWGEFVHGDDRFLRPWSLYALYRWADDLRAVATPAATRTRA